MTRLECVKVGEVPAIWPLARLVTGPSPLQLLSVESATSPEFSGHDPMAQPPNESSMSAGEACRAGSDPSQLLYLRALTPPDAALLGGMGRLRVLDLSGSTVQQLPETLSSLTGLQHLDLSDCGSLQQLSCSVGALTALQHLDLSDNRSLQQLPEGFSSLTCLQHLDLSGCASLQQLPCSIGALTALHYLDLSECRSLQQIPKCISSLTGLQHLGLSECGSLQQLPDSFATLSGL